MKWFFSVFFSLSFVFLAVFGVNCVYGYIFPKKYQEEVANASEVCDVDEPLIYSVINIESHFDVTAVSPKGAVGLMQILPTTAQEMAQSLGFEDFDLQNPQQNILLGTAYLSYLLDRFENLETAVSAYNAGPANVNLWLKNEKYSDDGVSLKEIPFAETKNYIEKFRKNYRYYKMAT